MEWLSESEMAARIARLSSHPFLIDDEGDIRLSLGGAQEKALVVIRGEQIGIPLHDTPSTHIIKPPISSEPGSLIAELFAMRLAAACNIRVADVALRAFGDRPVLVVERFDRQLVGDTVQRLHHETFGQALGIPVSQKYQADGGPGLADLVELIRDRNSGIPVPAVAVTQLLDLAVFNLIVGNTDAHAGNFAVLYDDAGLPQLAPAYDLLSVTSVLGKRAKKLAMSIGGEYRIGHIASRHIRRLADELGVSGVAARRRMAQLSNTMAEQAPIVARRVIEESGCAHLVDAAGITDAAVRGINVRVDRLRA
jgi:serine/threonine-protein kinase HipA